MIYEQAEKLEYEGLLQICAGKMPAKDAGSRLYRF